MTMNMYRKRCIRLTLLCAAAMLLSGCGGEYRATSGGSAESASGAAVSVSGQAVSDDAIQKNGKKHRFCSDSHLYYIVRSEQDDNVLVEHALSDGTERQIEIEGLLDVWYADNDWVYYEKLKEETRDYEYPEQFCRAPVEGERVNEKKEEVLFEKGEMEVLYCDGRYVLYNDYSSDEDTYMKYDIKEKKNMPMWKDYVEVLAVTDGSAFIYACADDEDSGVYLQDLDSDRMSKITDGYVVGGSIAYTGSEIFYVERFKGQSIWCYHLKEDSKERLVTDSQIKEFLIREGFLDDSWGEYDKYYLDRMFVSGERLYVQVEIEWSEDEGKDYVDYRNKAIFSRAITNEEDIRYEKELTECLANPEKNQKVVDKVYYRGSIPTVFLSRGTCIGMVGDKCFMRLYHTDKGKNMLAYYDLLTEELKFLTEKDPEWYLLLYDGMPPGWLDVAEETIPCDNDMPNNQEEIGYFW